MNITEYKAQKKKEDHKRWRDRNKDIIKLTNHKFYQANKDYFKTYYKENPHIKLKSGWKQSGIICDYDAIYEIYKDTHSCDFCGKTFKMNCKVLDHCHTCGCVRGVICRSPCNNRDLLKCHLCDL
tara:strand:- start:444 stop:818 length:375 start_codon:yes stop_codon:yes gene_type:complete